MKAEAENPARVRLQRVLAAHGIAARRACEDLILAGRVSVNGVATRTLPVFVDPASDHIVVDGRGLPKARAARAPRHAQGSGHSPSLAADVGRSVYVMLHKPAKVLSTTRDDGGRKTVLDLVQHPAAGRLFPVGRLDFHASGLVLLTNDGDLANRLTHARYGVEKTYLAHVRGVLDAAFVADVERGINLKQRRAAIESRASEGPARRGGRSPGAIAIGLARVHEDKTVLEVRLVDTGPRSVPDMLAEAGLHVMKLARVGIGPLALRGVGVGRWRELEAGEVRALRSAAMGAGGGAGIGPRSSGPLLPPPAGAARGRGRPASKPGRPASQQHYRAGGPRRAERRPVRNAGPGPRS